jgi:hypothetical protein
MTAEEAQAVIDARAEAEKHLLEHDETPETYLSGPRLASMASFARKETGTPDPGKPQTAREAVDDILAAMFPQAGEALEVLLRAELT